VLRPLVALVGLTVLVGCGAAQQAKGPKPAEPCPAGTVALKVKDVLPEPPPGTEIAAADPKSAKPVLDGFRQATGDGLRSMPTRVVVKRGRELGTLVVLLNADERMAARDLILGAKASADDAGAETKPLTIAGEDGALIVSSEGANAVGSVSDCTGVALFGVNEPEVRAVAEKLRRPE
jgi:hypothetical protein